METVNKVNKAASLGAAMLFLFPITLQQSVSPLQQAFCDSYTAEAKASYDDAIKSVNAVYDASSYECNLRLGWLYYEKMDYTKSTEYYKKAMDIHPYAIEAKFGYVKPASALLKWDDVLATYQSILKIDPQNTTANYWTGMIYYNRADYKSAAGYFEKVVNLYPFDYDSSLMLGWSYLSDGRSSDAKILFDKVLLIRPGDKSATEGLSKLK